MIGTYQKMSDIPLDMSGKSVCVPVCVTMNE